MLLNCITPFRADSPPAHSASISSSFSSTPLTMEFSLDELCTAGDWSPPAWYVRIEWGYCWLGTSAREGDCVGPVDGSPPTCSVWILGIRGGCRLETSEREGDWFCAVFDSLGSEKMTRLTEIPVSPSPSSRCLAPPRHAAGSTTGSKRRIRETSFYHSVQRLSEGPSKKLRKLGHQTHHNWHAACSSDSNIRKSRPNSMGKDCDKRKTSASKSCEENSQYHCFCDTSVMRMPSDLDSFLRYGGWNSFASATVRTLFAGFDLRLICCFRVRDQSVSGDAGSVEVIRKKATSTGWDFVPNDLKDHIDGLRRVRRFRKRQQSVPSKTISEGVKKPTTTTWDSLPNDLQANVLQRVDFRDLFRFKTLSNSWKKFIESDAFRVSRGAKSEGSFTAIHYYIKNQSWRCSGYDLHSKSWKALPPFSHLPLPDAELFREFSVCGHGTLMCADVSEKRKGELVVCNPLTGKTKALPPLLYPRNPVLLHIWVDSLQKSYKVIVAGSTASSQNWRKPNCKIMEVFDSSTSKWKETGIIPGPSFGLSKHQTGVIVNGRLFFISYLDDYRHPRGDYVLAWDMENWRYLEKWVCPIPFVPDSKSLLQLVENDGKVYLFSESKEDVQGQGVQGPGIVCHRIDEMEFPDRNTGATACQWRKVVEVTKTGVQEICMYPDFRRDVADFLCMGFGKGKLCIFNTLNRDGVVYDMLDGTQCEVLKPPPAHQTGDKVFSLNPASFTLHPSFASDP